MEAEEKEETIRKIQYLQKVVQTVIFSYVVISVMSRALLRHDSNLYYPTLLNKLALHLEFWTLEVLECAVPSGWERPYFWGGLRAPSFGI